MAVKASEIFERIEEHFPKCYALEWDNPGLTCGSGKKEVSKVLIALDCTEGAIDQAKEHGCDLILTHHPMIFGSIKNVTDESFLGRRLISLIRHDISLYAMHTNFDCAPEGMGRIVAKRLGIGMLKPMELTGETADGEAVGVGFYGELPEAMSAKELSERIKESFDIGSVIYYDAGNPIRTVACCPGSGRGMFKYAKELGADAFLTGDMGHHDGIDAVAEGITLIDAGHYGLEHIFVDHMKGFMKEHFPKIECVGYEEDQRSFV